VIHSPLSFLLVAILAAYLLHALWQITARRDGVAAACLVAAYPTLGMFVRLLRPDAPMLPLLAPFVYPYAWLAIAALFWLPSAMRPARRGLLLCHGSPQVAAVLIAPLCLHLGVLALVPLSDAGSLAMYLLLSPLLALQAWLVAIILHWLLRRGVSPRVSWWSIATLALIPSAASLALARAAVPVLLRYY
jgi:hypothetical protein